ncbi:Transmembrane protein 223 [Anthophora quadrimaculata]
MFLNFPSYKNVTNFISKLHIVCKPLTKNSKCRNLVLYQSFHSSQRCSLKVNNIRACNKQIKSDVIDVNTNVSNNVIMYKHEKKLDSIMLKMLFFGWGFCSMIMAYYTYNSKFILTFSENLSWKEYFKINGINLIYFLYATTLGPLTCVFLFVLNQRFVKYIILHKGGQHVSVITTHLFKNNNIFTLPVNEVQTMIARNQMKNYLPLKIRGKKFYYIIDGEGKFLNGKLFDYTVGTRKIW